VLRVLAIVLMDGVGAGAGWWTTYRAVPPTRCSWRSAPRSS